MEDTCCEYVRNRCHRGRRGRGVRSPALSLILAACILTGSALLSRHPEPAIVSSKRITVVEGDALWTIALRNPVEGMTTAQTVDLIVRLNDLSSASIAPGARLVVPVTQPRNTVVAMN